LKPRLSALRRGFSSPDKMVRSRLIPDVSGPLDTLGEGVYHWLPAETGVVGRAAGRQGKTARGLTPRPQRVRIEVSRRSGRNRATH